MSIGKAAAYTGFEPQTLRNYVRKGYLPDVRICGRYQFFESDLDRLLTEGTPQTTTSARRVKRSRCDSREVAAIVQARMAAQAETTNL